MERFSAAIRSSWNVWYAGVQVRVKAKAVRQVGVVELEDEAGLDDGLVLLV